MYHGYQSDYLEAFRWMRPRMSRWKVVYVTTLGANEPFSAALVALRWDPHRWFTEPRIVRTNEQGWDVYDRFGPVRFLVGRNWKPEIDRLQADGRDERALFVVRPGELGLTHPSFEVRRPDGQPTLWLCEATI